MSIEEVAALLYVVTVLRDVGVWAFRKAQVSRRTADHLPARTSTGLLWAKDFHTYN
jgi:hypothetical protein